MTDKKKNDTTFSYKFWENKPLEKLNFKEWEALCDGCGKCCLNKIEDEETGQVFLTRIACRLFNDESCLCSNYKKRHKYVPECIKLTASTIKQNAYWLPSTCAYKLIYEKGVEPKVFLNEFLEILYYLKNISYIELEGTNFNLNDNEHKLIKELNENLGLSTILIYWQFTINTLSELNIVSNQHLTIEMFILRLIYLSNNENMTSNSEEKSFFSKDETSEVIEKKTNYNVINQLKNIDQKQENKPEVKAEENHNSIKSFQDLIELCTLKKEFNLKYDLESNVRLVSFDKNFIEISFNENLDKNFIKILSAKLFEWTSERWIITLSKKQGRNAKERTNQNGKTEEQRH